MLTPEFPFLFTAAIDACNFVTLAYFCPTVLFSSTLLQKMFSEHWLFLHIFVNFLLEFLILCIGVESLNYCGLLD